MTAWAILTVKHECKCDPPVAPGARGVIPFIRSKNAYQLGLEFMGLLGFQVSCCFGVFIVLVARKNIHSI